MIAVAACVVLLSPLTVSSSTQVIDVRARVRANTDAVSLRTRVRVAGQLVRSTRANAAGPYDGEGYDTFRTRPWWRGRTLVVRWTLNAGACSRVRTVRVKVPQ